MFVVLYECNIVLLYFIVFLCLCYIVSVSLRATAREHGHSGSLTIQALPTIEIEMGTSTCRVWGVGFRV